METVVLFVIGMVAFLSGLLFYMGEHVEHKKDVSKK